MSGTLPACACRCRHQRGLLFDIPSRGGPQGQRSTSAPSGLSGSVSGSGHLRCSSRWRGPSGSSSAQSSRSKHPHPWGVRGSRNRDNLLPSRKHRLTASRSWHRTDLFRFPACSPRSGQITYREVRPTRSSPPLTLVLVNDYAVVVEGLKPVLAPFSDRVRVVDLAFSGDLKAQRLVLWTLTVSPDVVAAARANGASGVQSWAMTPDEPVDALERIHAGRWLSSTEPRTLRSGVTGPAARQG